MLVEWIHCLSGKRGKITVFPAAVSADGNNPGVTLRLAENGVKICPDFRAKDISFNGKKVLSSALLEPGVPAFLRMGKSLLVASCAKNATDETDWAAHYRFPLWTLFEPETLDGITCVRSPAEIPDALARHGLAAENCLVAPYGITATIPLAAVADLF